MFDGDKIARVEQPEAGTRDSYVQEGQSIYSPLVSVHDEAADAQYWYLFDALGSTMGLVDANGNLWGKLQYDAFGNVLAEEDVPRSAFLKYVGAYQYMPEEFEGMMLLWLRWYDPSVGLFVSPDPVIVRAVHDATYRYVESLPTSRTDAMGAKWIVTHDSLTGEEYRWWVDEETWRRWIEIMRRRWPTRYNIDPTIWRGGVRAESWFCKTLGGGVGRKSFCDQHRRAAEIM